MHGETHGQSKANARRIVVTGATGLVGSALCEALSADGVELVRLSRSKQGPGWSIWNPDQGQIDGEVFEGAAAVVHLAGENIGSQRWTKARKRALWESRTRSTGLLATTIAACRVPPKTLISASGTNFYGDRGDAELDERSPAGGTFLAELCKAWEGATQPAADAGMRVICLRSGMVLAPRGGALDRMLPVFKAGVAGKLASGRQYMPWIALDDEVGVLRFLLDRPEIHGPVNAVAPRAVTNAEFTHTLAGVLHRPAFLPAPAFAIRAAFGQMGHDLLLASLRVQPRVLLDAGYEFRWPTLEAALTHVLET